MYVVELVVNVVNGCRPQNERRTIKKGSKEKMKGWVDEGGG